jgi:S1-C subfamily serine protease
MEDDTEQPGTEPAAPDDPAAPESVDEVPAGSTPEAGPPTAAPPPPVPPVWPLPPADQPTEPTPAPAVAPLTMPLPATVPVNATPPPFGAEPYPPPHPAAGASAQAGKSRSWMGIAIVAALVGAIVGGGIGAGVTAIADHNSNGNGSVTIHESNSAPGAAVLSGNVTIPQLVNKVIPAVVSIDVKSDGNEDQGTGMIVTSNGEVITNNHVIELYTQGGDSGSITVTEYGQIKSIPATLVGYDATKDVALLKINGASGLPTVTFGSSAKTQVGDAVVAIGNALGLAAGTPTVTQGIVSALGRSVTAGGDGTVTENLSNLIQTDAAINPGNSGGPLIDTAAQVIGMNTAVAGTSDDGTSSQNIGFAIPIAQVEALIPELEKGGQSGNGGAYLGVDITTLTAALRQQYGFTPTSGAVVLTVISGSPADKAGLVQGDVIVAIDGTAITSAENLQSAVQKDKAGQSVTITYYVGDNKHTTTATLGSQEEEQQEENQGQSNSGSGGLGAGGFPGFGNSGGTP